MLHGRPYTQHVFPVNIFSGEVDVGDPYTFLFIKRGILQYVYVKPITAALTMVLKSANAYHEGSISLKSGYFWMMLISNLSVFLSLYCFSMFFMATKTDLEDFRPVPKFICIKAVLFLTFWQGIAIAILVATGLLHDCSPEIAVAFQDALICFEMSIASFGHLYAFSYKDYIDPEIPSARMPIYYALRDAFGIQDIIEDSRETLQGTRFTYRTFEPSEGVATIGRSRSGRIMAGLRYSAGGTSKYWLPLHTNSKPTEQESPLEEYDMTMTDEGPIRHGDKRRSYGRRAGDTVSLRFSDVDSEDGDGLEELFQSSKKLEHGDYNFPAIDVYDPNLDSQDEPGMERLQVFAQEGSSSSSSSSDPSRSYNDLLTHHERGVSESASTRSLYSETSSSAPSTLVSVESSTTGHSVKVRDGCVENVNGFVPPPPKAPRWKRQLRGTPSPVASSDKQVLK
ncbi:hypothetical protein EMPS_00225 [Entomortierella parvispora]|uniref:Uncharacterized protein n=1 Tax=Entomortierella parvispora TaxID=205924 RepID=A0A9P3GZX8_9FUNG|nr:hypothetical protein EMPS_00225 [Entomortierella parvispora]